MSSEKHGFVHHFQPPKTQNAPIFATLHSIGGDEHELDAFVGQVNQDAGIISLRGKIVENEKHKFFKKRADDTVDEEEIRQHAKEVVQFMNRAAEDYNFDRKELIWLGYSNGAHLIGAIMLLFPTVIEKAILLRPNSIVNPSPLPVFADVSVLISAGRTDEHVPMENTERLIRTFQHCGAIVELFLHDAGHELTEADSVAAQKWMLRQHK